MAACSTDVTSTSDTKLAVCEPYRREGSRLGETTGMQEAVVWPIRLQSASAFAALYDIIGHNDFEIICSYCCARTENEKSCSIARLERSNLGRISALQLTLESCGREEEERLVPSFGSCQTDTAQRPRRLRSADKPQIEEHGGSGPFLE